MKLQVPSLASLSGLRIWRCRELCVGRRRGSDPTLLWLRLWPAATAPIRPLAWKPPYAMGVALEKTKREGKKKRERDVALGDHLFLFFKTYSFYYS